MFQSGDIMSSQSDLLGLDSVRGMEGLIGQAHADRIMPLSMPQPKRAVDSNLLDSFYRSDEGNHGGMPQLSSSFEQSSQYINDLFHDGSMYHENVDMYREVSRPSSRILGIIGNDKHNNNDSPSLAAQHVDFDIPGGNPYSTEYTSSIVNPSYTRPASTPIFSSNNAYYQHIYSSVREDPSEYASEYRNQLKYSNYRNSFNKKSVPTPPLTGIPVGGGYPFQDSQQSSNRNNKYGAKKPSASFSMEYNNRNTPISSVHRNHQNIQAINSQRHSAAPALYSKYPHHPPPPHHHHHHHSSNLLTSSTISESFDPTQVENLVTKTCRDILKEASNHSLKAVELANTLRARVGTEVLAVVRENWGGLLSLLERYNKFFVVDRIPKNDMVTLRDDSGWKRENPGSSVGVEHDHVDESLVATKCLHVSNLPINYTEKELISEFEKFGYLDSVNIINQRGRRFAFVSFRTREIAMFAKQQLSHIMPWANSISYAHKDSEHDLNSFDPNNQAFSNWSASSSKSTTPTPGSNPMSGFDLTHSGESYSPPPPGVMPSYMNGSSVYEEVFPPLATSGMNMTSTLNDSFGTNGPCSVSGSHSSASLFNQVILRRLCDDTYVPTQPWQKDADDFLFCEAIIVQLQQFGGSTSISKLRGFLRSRINASDNIKSVPLKAMLAAYPQYFCVRNNQVSLLRQHGPGNSNSGGFFESMDTSGLNSGVPLSGFPF